VTLTLADALRQAITASTKGNFSEAERFVLNRGGASRTRRGGELG
jgi:hypothetical protein